MKSNRGFSLMTVILVLSVVSISAMLVIRLVAEDHDLIAEERRSREVRENAESGLMEVLNDNSLGDALPTLTSPGQEASYSRSAGSHLGDYHGTIELARIVPMRESSYSVVRAVVYDVRLSTQTNEGHRADLSAEIYKIASSQNGVVQPRRHAR